MMGGRWTVVLENEEAARLAARGEVKVGNRCARDIVMLSNDQQGSPRGFVFYGHTQAVALESAKKLRG